jgi:transcriptional regulator with XRE-family HTH domain
MIEKQAQRIGRMIATARRNKGLSLRQVSEQTGIPHTWLFRMEHGEFLAPTPDRLVRLAETLGVDPDKIERVAKGQMSNSLPGVRTYFRAKYDLTTEEIDKIERTVQDIQRKHEGRNTT